MPRIINRGLNSATTTDWINATKGMKLSAYDPCAADSRAVLTTQKLETVDVPRVQPTDSNRRSPARRPGR